MPLSSLSMKLKPREITSSAVFAVLTAIGAWISIPLPITPVPFTLQVFFVLLSGAVLGGKLGALAQMIYVLLGLIGFPVFAGGASGPGVLIGPTGGYLIGFIFAAYVTGQIAQRHPSSSVARTALATLLGLIPIYSLGGISLWIWLKSSIPLLLMAGVIPFLPGDIIKAIIAAFIATRKQVVQLTHRLTP